MDYYSFEISKGKDLVFDVISSREAAAGGFHPQMTLYGLAPSWFNPERAKRLAFTDQLRGETVIVDADPRNKTGTWVNLKHRSTEAGRYYLEVGSLYGKGGPENIYQLRVAESGHVRPLVFWRQHSWQERSFTRKVGSSHIQDLWTRTVAQSTDTGAAVIVEKEPNGVEGQALEVSVPVVLEGEIDHESDVDTFRFKTTRGQKLAFEIETPQSAPPAFNPRVDVFD